jgi:hypothetical protein
MTSERSYRAYLLRIWLEDDQNLSSSPSWRFSLEDAHTHARQGFRDLDALLAYLNDLTSSYPTTSYPVE